jgi:predicted acyl esterase
LQKRFFDHFLKSADNGWDREPPVRIAVRHADGAIEHRAEHEWPLARTEWTKLFLDASTLGLREDAPDQPSQQSYAALGEGLTFVTAPFDAEMEFTGPASVHLVMASSTTDLDIFVMLRVMDPDGHEVTFVGAHEEVPLARGWLRASHRKLDPVRTLTYRPYHTHTEVQKLTPGMFYNLNVEIWPTSIVLPAGFRLALTLRGRDLEFATRGRMLHDDPADRPADEFAGEHSLATGPDSPAYLLLPRIPRPASQR